jgi:mRNA-degrading endonuclease RelE of RelBE toxin-antitoxin system
LFRVGVTHAPIDRLDRAVVRAGKHVRVHARSYRIVYRIDEAKPTVTVLDVDHRGAFRTATPFAKSPCFLEDS